MWGVVSITKYLDSTKPLSSKIDNLVFKTTKKTYPSKAMILEEVSYNSDTDEFFRFKNNSKFGFSRQIHIKKKKYPAAVISFIIYNDFPPLSKIVFIDRKPLNYRPYNLSDEQ